MLEQEFKRLYRKFRLWHYRTIFAQVGERSGSLTATEALSAEVIFLLDRPTVKEFAEFLHISQPNATYKINQLTAKGYLKKDPSPQDKREFRLEVTDKFADYYCTSAPFIGDMLQNVRTIFTSEEVEQLERMIRRITDEAL